jgi:NADH-quinone oxidoreductase subunit L
MVSVLVVLAALSTVGGVVGLPFVAGGHPFARWLEPVFRPAAGHDAAAHGAAGAHHLAVGTEVALLGLAVAIALVGWYFARRLYAGGLEPAERLRARVAAAWRLLENKYWVDELYDAVVVRPLARFSDHLWRFWDVRVVDGTANGVGYLVSAMGALLGLLQTGFVGTYALFITLGVAALLLWLGGRP